MPRKLWVDCDPGHDDAMALILAAFTDGVELVGVSTAAGNVTIANTTRNALRVLHAVGRDDVVVVRGEEHPLLVASELCPEVHGESGLGGADLPDSPVAPVCPESTAAELYARLQQHGSVEFIATGRLTNLALLVKCFPNALKHISRISIMGGAIGFGNWPHPAAEFNIRGDPEAAAIVCSVPDLCRRVGIAPIDVVFVPLEVTHTVLITPEIETRLCVSGSPFARIFRRLLTFFADTYRDVFEFASPPLHDPCAVAYALRPELFDARRVFCDVVTGDSTMRGHMNFDMHGVLKRDANVVVTRAVDVAAFWDLMCAAFARADAASVLTERDAVAALRGH